jgi:hypothetical protein
LRLGTASGELGQLAADLGIDAGELRLGQVTAKSLPKNG